MSWRHRGGRKPAGTVYVGRPSRWGNPYTIAEYGSQQAVELFRHYVTADPELAATARREPAGYDLACWCTGSPCHADVLLALANSPA